MSAQIMDCKLVAQAIKDECKIRAGELKARGIIPKLAIIRVGEKGPDLSYEKGAAAAMNEAGIEVEVFALPADVSQDEYIEKFRAVNADSSVHGILAFRPLDNIDENEAISANINPLKDVDACTVANMGKVVMGDPTGLFPCTAGAITEIIDYYKIDVKGKNVAVINNSNVIGKPVSMMLTNRFATVTVCHEFSKNTREICLDADIIICAVPVENIVKASWVKPGAVVIDASVIRKKEFDDKGEPVINEKTGRQKTVTVGCCEDGVSEVAGMKTPVPGVGSVTSAYLAKNLIRACMVQNNIR